MKTTNVDPSDFLYHILCTLGTETVGRQKSSNVYDNNGGVVLLDDHDLLNLWQSAVRLVKSRIEREYERVMRRIK